MNTNSYFCSVCGTPIKRQQKQTVVAERTDIICENDHICQSCCKLAVQSYRQLNSNVALEMEVFEDTEQPCNGKHSNNGDNSVCLMCNTSLLSRQSLPIIKHDPTELDNLMLNLISEAIPHQTKISNEDKVCSKCWFKIRRSALGLQQINKVEPNGTENGNQLEETKSEPESDHCEYLVVEIKKSDSENCDSHKGMSKSQCEDSDNASGNDFKDDPDDPDFTVNYPINNKIQEKDQNSPAVLAKIQLPNYNRCACSSRKCVFSCNNRQRHKVPNAVREKMLRDYKFYISKDTRVCQQHLQSNNWNDLLRIASLTKDKPYQFNTNHIEDMFSMVKIEKKTDLDFNNILNFDDHFIQYLLGIKKEILNSILVKEPKIKQTCNGLYGLLGLLLKHRKGGTDERIRNLLKISRTTLRRAMEDVKNVLSKSPVTKELGIEYLLDIIHATVF